MESCFQATLRRKVISLNGPETAQPRGHLEPSLVLFASRDPVDDARPPIKSVQVRQQSF